MTTPGAGKTFASYTSPTQWAYGGITTDYPSTSRPISWGSGGATFNITDPANIFTISQQLTTANCRATWSRPARAPSGSARSIPRRRALSQANDNEITSMPAPPNRGHRILGGTLVLDYSGDQLWRRYRPPENRHGPAGPGQRHGGDLRQRSRRGLWVPGYADYIPAETVSGLTLLPGDSRLQSRIASRLRFHRRLGHRRHQHDLATGRGQLESPNAWRSASYNISPTNGSPGAVTAWLTSSTFIDDNTLGPALGDQYWDTEFAGVPASSYAVGGTQSRSFSPISLPGRPDRT